VAGNGGKAQNVALITGAASGIGRATARAFARVGVAVVVADVDSAGNDVVREIGDGGGQASFVEVDVSLAADCDRMVEHALSTYGRLDFAHNNAGIGLTEGIPFWDITEGDWERVFAVNAKGVWLSMKAEFPALRENGGAIVNTGSIVAHRAHVGGSAYAATKAAIAILTRIAAQEAAAFGVRVNGVAPGVTETAGLLNIFEANPGMREDVGVRIPLARLGTADDIANAVVWLCSPEAAYVTGQVLVIDGGLTDLLR